LLIGATQYKELADWKVSEMDAETENWFSLAGVFPALT